MCDCIDSPMTPNPKEALELLPCPFCGETTIYFNAPDEMQGWRGSINCPACLVTMPRECGDQELVDCWNTRAAPGTKPAGERREAIALEFRPGNETPDVKQGSYSGFIVVTENDNGKHFAFAGYYLNAYPLQYDECRCKEPCEDGCPTTGWFYDESNFEYENCYYPISSRVVRWAPIPKADAILASGLMQDENSIRAALAQSEDK